MKKILYFIVPILIGIVFAFGLSKFLDNKILSLVKSKNLVPLMSQYESEIKDKGVLINEYLLSKGDIMMLGSSELSKTIKRQHPTEYFNTNTSKNKIFITGRPYSQDLQDILTLGSADSKGNSDLKSDNKKKRVVLLVSMQWFLREDGIAAKEFQNRFSPAQFYTYLNNSKISKKNKDYVARRVSELLKRGGRYNSEAIYARLYTNHSMIGSIAKSVLEPYEYLRKKMVSFNERGLLYEELEKLPNENYKNIKKSSYVNWRKEDLEAIKDAKKRVGANKYKIDNGYYNDILKKKLKNMKNRYSKVNLLESKELDDYKTFLSICKDLDIDATIVIMPNAKWYYDYTGLSQKKRDVYYDTIDNLAKVSGFNVINLKDKETENYYLRDIMHIGTRGWVDISERLYKQYNK